MDAVRGFRVLGVVATCLIATCVLSQGSFAQGVDPLPPVDPPPPVEPSPVLPTDITGTNFQEEYGRIVSGGESVSALDMGQFGESVDLASGKTEFTATDVSLPGNNAIPVTFGRSRSVENLGGGFTRTLGDWEMDIPYMEGVFVAGQGWVVNVGTTIPEMKQRCAGPTEPDGRDIAPGPVLVGVGGTDSVGPEEYWQGIHLHVPGQGRQEVLSLPASDANPRPTQGGAYRYVTSGRWYLACEPFQVGQLEDGFVAHAPNGLIYHFNHIVTEGYAPLSRPRGGTKGGTYSVPRERVRLYVGSIQDRYQKTVTYNWAGSKLSSISASDGRTLTLTHNGPDGVLSSITDGTRTWSYDYAAGSRPFLDTVTLPDTTQWKFDFKDFNFGVVGYSQTGAGNMGYDTRLTCNWMKELSNGSDPKRPINRKSITLTHPSGAKGVFTVEVKRHGRSLVESACIETQDDERSHFPATPARFDAWSIVSKSVTGPGIPAAYLWEYDYQLPIGSFVSSGPVQNCPADPLGACPPTKKITVTAPDGSRTSSVFGIKWQNNDGQLLSMATCTPYGGPTPIGDLCGPTANVITKTTNTYVDDVGATTSAFAPELGQSPQFYLDDSWQGTRVRPMRTRVLEQQGTLANQSTTFTHDITAFDTYARPATVVKSSSAGYSKTDVTTYDNNTGLWVVGQVATVAVDGTQASKTIYNTDARPSEIWQFGKKQYDITYHASGADIGNVSTVTDRNNHATSYTNYERGIAKNVGFSDGHLESATVNNIGLVTSITTAITAQDNVTTFYDYNATSGRLEKIRYPTGGPTWNEKNFSFVPIGQDYGLLAGHWRQTVTQGNAKTETDFDALWRPVVTKTLDTADQPGTQRMTLNKYDYAGRTTFASYVKPDIALFTSSPDGVTSSYDVIGRLTATHAASELGALGTSIVYESGAKKKVTNPRGYVTTTSYQAFDAPSDDAPTLIVEPGTLSTDTVTTTILRDSFGKPLTMTRTGTEQFGGSTQTVERSYQYDDYERLCLTREPESGASLIGYDDADNIEWRASGQTIANGTTCENATVAANRKINYQYDERNRPILTTFGDNSPSITTTYTDDGLPWTVTSDGSVWTYLYNNRRLLMSESLTIGGATYPFGHTYNVNGHESVLTYPDLSTVDYAPNALGEATQAWPYAIGVTRHPNGAIANFSYANGVVHEGTQTVRGLPKKSTDALGSTNILNDEYAWDENGNVTSIISTNTPDRPSRTMQYDARDRLSGTGFDKRLIQWDPDLAAAVSFSYDPLDNLRSYSTGTNGRDYTHLYDASNRLDEIRNASNAVVYDYSYAGTAGERGVVTGRNLGSGFNVQNYTVGLDERVRGLTGSITRFYKYDGLGRRTQLLSDTDTAVQVYSQAGKLLWLNTLAAGAFFGPPPSSHAKFVYLGNHLIAREIQESFPIPADEALNYLHTDGLGSPVASTTPSGALVAGSRKLHEPYGLDASGVIPPQGPGYAGHVVDNATGLSYMQQRYYDPIAARFLSVDPVNANPSNGSNFNRYWYANNSPYKYFDPDGRVAEDPQESEPIDESEPERLATTIVVAPMPNSSPGFSPINYGAVGRVVMSIGGRIAPPLMLAFPSSIGAAPCEMGGTPCGMQSMGAPKDATNPNGAKAPGLPGKTEGYTPGKSGPRWVPNPNGVGGGWEDSKGNVWVPTGPGGAAHGGPHWDVQKPGGGYENVYPGGNKR